MISLPFSKFDSNAPPLKIQYGDCMLESAFQPIIAVAQSRTAGVEALLRAKDRLGAGVEPLELFSKAARPDDLPQLDRLAIQTHLEHIAALGFDDRWIFLNCRPETLAVNSEGYSALETEARRWGIKPSRIVVEVLEEASYSNKVVTVAILDHQAKGFQVAIDDFGVGSSNFDRVWGVKPDFVKLDRSLVRPAALSRNDRRVAKMLVAMLHRMGVMVIAEGVETAEQALAVMDADVDFVQGYYFARPSQKITTAVSAADDAIVRLWPRLSDMVFRVGAQERAQIAAVRSMLLSATRALEAGASLADAAALFFAAPNTFSVYLLDKNGHQVGPAERRHPISQELQQLMYPILQVDGTNWVTAGLFQRCHTSPRKTQPARTASHARRRCIHIHHGGNL